MNNDNSNAKLSKLIYALASDDPEYLSKAGAFDRSLLLVRELYRILDEIEGLKQLVFRLYYGKHYGLIKLDAASPNDDAGALRLKRWMVYSRIAERIENCGKHLSVVLEDVVLENGADKSHYIDEANAIIERFGRYQKISDSGIHMRAPFGIDKIAARVQLRVLQSEIVG